MTAAARCALWLRLALREIRNHPRFAAFFVINLGIGLSGFAALDAFEASVDAELRSRSQAFLGADLAISSSRPFLPEEVERFDALAGEGAQVSAGAQLFSMAQGLDPAAGIGRSQLVEIRAIDARFPLYGAVVLDVGGAADSAARGRLFDETGAWVDPVLLGQLGVEIGDFLRIGSMSFRVLDTVARDTGRATSGFSIAPRIYIAVAHLGATELVTTGSRVQYNRLYKLPVGAPLVRVVERIRVEASDERLRVQSHEEATRSLARVYGAVASYLGLVSIIAVFLAGLGSAYLFRAFLARRLRDVAITMSLGGTRGDAQGVFLAQLWLLAAVASLLACGFAALLLPGVAAVARDFLPPGAEPRVGLRTVLASFALAMLGSGAACLPLLVRIRSLRPAELFREGVSPSLERGPRDFLLLLPALALFWLLAVWRAGDFAVGSLFAAIFGVALAVLAFAARTGLRGLARVPRLTPLAPRLALRQLARGGGSGVAGFVSVALCALMVSLAPQLQSVLAREVDPPEGSSLPSLFLFDIQPEQIGPLGEHLREQGTELQRTSPMVRARLTAIDGEPVRATRAESDTASSAAEGRSSETRRLRTRRYNLTYRPALSPSEKLVEGRPFAAGDFEPQELDGVAGTLPELSIEVEFARSLGVGVGSRLAFDVQGVPVEGRVVNLREVRWNSFQPNFFVVFQSGVLEEAPQIYLASVPRLPNAEREALQASIVERFRNVSVIDVTRSVKRLLALLAQLQWALTSTATLSLAVGLLLIFAIARDQARARRWEINLLKVLGADFTQIRRVLDIEFGVLGLLATVAGIGCSCLASAILSAAVLGATWSPAWEPLLFTGVAIPVICVATARIAARGVLRERPLALLQSAES